MATIPSRWDVAAKSDAMKAQPNINMIAIGVGSKNRIRFLRACSTVGKSFTAKLYQVPYMVLPKRNRFQFRRNQPTFRALIRRSTQIISTSHTFARIETSPHSPPFNVDNAKHDHQCRYEQPNRDKPRRQRQPGSKRQAEQNKRNQKQINKPSPGPIVTDLLHKANLTKF